NNTFKNVALGVFSSSGGGTWNPESRFQNNILYSVNLGSTVPTRSYNFYSYNETGSETGKIINGSNPFVDLANNNYRLTSSISSTLPRNKGTPVADADGQIFSSD